MTTDSDGRAVGARTAAAQRAASFSARPASAGDGPARPSRSSHAPSALAARKPDTAPSSPIGAMAASPAPMTITPSVSTTPLEGTTEVRQDISTDQTDTSDDDQAVDDVGEGEDVRRTEQRRSVNHEERLPSSRRLFITSCSLGDATNSPTDSWRRADRQQLERGLAADRTAGVAPTSAPVDVVLTPDA